MVFSVLKKIGVISFKIMNSIHKENEKRKMKKEIDRDTIYLYDHLRKVFYKNYDCYGK